MAAFNQQDQSGSKGW